MSVDVPEGMLTPADRRLIILSNKERLPVIVGTLHACPFDLVGGRRRKLPCEEPAMLLGWISDYNQVVMLVTHPGMKKAAEVPWLSAVRVWRPDDGIAVESRWQIIKDHAVGSVAQVHP